MKIKKKDYIKYSKKIENKENYKLRKFNKF